MTAFDETTENIKYLPVFPKASNLIFNSGNIVSSNRLKKKSNISSDDELIDVFNSTLESWLGRINRSEIQECKTIECRNPEFYEKIDPSNKHEITVSVKLFLNTLSAEALDQSIESILSEIGADHIDSLILSLSDKIFTHDDLPIDVILPLWSVIQKHIQNKTIESAGLADFNAKNLEMFINALDDKNQMPALNQVNLVSCCKMPEDLVELAKINNVQLTTHNDPKEILTISNLQSNIKKYTHDYDSIGWAHSWVARYTLLLKGRGILKSKGYILSAQRELRYTK